MNESAVKNRVVDPDLPQLADHDYTYIPTAKHLSACSEKIVAYIAGYVVFKLRSSLHCDICVNALTDVTDDGDTVCSLIKHKTRGGLICPSADVIDICIRCEKYFRHNVARSQGRLSQISCHEIVQAVVKSFL